MNFRPWSWLTSKVFVVSSCALLSLSTAAQWAVGVHAGAGYDNDQSANLLSAGIRLEVRPNDSCRTVWRAVAQQAWLPAEDHHFELNDPIAGQAAFVTNSIRMRSLTLALELKRSLSTAECTDGYFTGAYLFFGGGLLRTVRSEEVTFEGMANGQTITQRNISSTDQLRLRLGLGTQRTFTWGALFAEALMTVGQSDRVKQLLIPATLEVQAGYRYQWHRK